MVPKFHIVEHPGREQPFTIWGDDGYVWQFCKRREDAQLWIHVYAVRRRNGT